MSQRVLLSWSSGKDSAWTLHTLRKDPGVEVVGLLTTVNATHGRVAMHSTRLAILEAQARAVGLPLHVVPLPWPCSNEAYERAMQGAIEDGLKGGGQRTLPSETSFWRTSAPTGSSSWKAPASRRSFLIWHEPTEPLARRMIAAGVEAVLTCVDPKQLSPKFVGRKFDHQFLDELPKGVDPCGENGEFHTCVLAGPMFREPVHASVGEVVERGGFWFADLLPDSTRVHAQDTASPPAR